MSVVPLLAGAAIRDITPPAGLAMAGFAARVDPALGAHDSLSARALAIGDTALVILDVIGVTQESTARIIAASGLPEGRVIVQASHTHGGPASMEGRLWVPPDPAWLSTMEAAAAEALREAWVNRRPARLSLAQASNDEVGRNRRHPGGVTDPVLGLLRVDGVDGSPIALLANYACHPVVLAADNRLWTADYPHFLRSALERAAPGALALFATGFVGDVNTGHAASGSVTLSANPARTFARAEEIGAALVRDLLASRLQPLGNRVGAAAARIEARLARSAAEADPDALIAAWQAELPGADPVRATLLRIWIDWAGTRARETPEAMQLPVTVLDWGGLLLIGLPGEIFAEAALSLRAALAPRPVLLLGFVGDNPGYIPPAGEYAHGGYEVEEAHRFYGQPAGFASGTSEALCDEALRLAGRIMTTMGEGGPRPA